MLKHSKTILNDIVRFRRVCILLVAVVSIGFVSMYPAPTSPPPIEICDNGIDDDGDGLIDLNDTADCECNLIEPVSLIPNSSFEDINCCPNLQSELSCASGWIQASYPTTDFIHTCGWLGWNNEFDQFPPPQPFPDGQGIVGFRDGVYFPPGDGPDPMEVIRPNWKEYVGACLLSPMRADSSYYIEFDIGFVDSIVSPPIAVTLFGTTDCVNLPFGGGKDDPLTGCPTNVPEWVELGAVGVVGGEDIWVRAAIEVLHDEDIRAIAIGPSCANNLNGHNRYYFLDNIILDEFESFQINVSSVSQPCAEDFALEVEDYPELSYQWYKDGIALVGETSSKLSQIYGEGNYQIRTINDTDCMLSGIYPFTVPLLINTVYHSICEGESFLFGDQELTEPGFYSDTLSVTSICDSVVVLELEIENAEVDSITAMIFEGESLDVGNQSFSQPGEYEFTVTPPDGCDVQTFLQLSFHEVLIPNIFSPNFDGVNDLFAPTAIHAQLQQVEMTIFDRWGGIIYKGAEWDGLSNDEVVNPGVYIYIMKITLDDDTSKLFSGSVMVML